MYRKCKTCNGSVCGNPDALSDVCDGCQNDSDTGWSGFTDHSLNRHFENEQERQEYLKKYKND